MSDITGLDNIGKRISFSRGTIYIIRKCRFCKLDTNRCLAAKIEGQGAEWDIMPLCPNCYNLIHALPFDDLKVPTING